MAILIDNSRLKTYYNKLRPVLRNKNAPAYFMLTLSLLSLSFFGAFAIRPTLSTIAELQKQISDSKDAYKSLQEKRANLLILQSEYKNIEQDIPIVLAALPNKVDAPIFLLKVRSVAALNNITISNLGVLKSPLSEDKKTNEPISSTFNLTATGSYRNLNNFLSDIATLDRIITFSNIGFKARSGGETLTLQLTSKIYTLFD